MYTNLTRMSIGSLKKFPIKKPWNYCFRAMWKVALGDLYVKFSFRVPLDNGIE